MHLSMLSCWGGGGGGRPGKGGGFELRSSFQLKCPTPAYGVNRAYTISKKKAHQYSNICKKYAPEYKRDKTSSIEVDGP